ncbi:MAG: hypothetical protein AAF543_03200 [Pseudomonadota bacterium]
MDRVADLAVEDTPEIAADKQQDQAPATTYSRDWGQHPLNLRFSLPLPFGRWYVTLVAGKERRGKERLVEERKKHPLETVPNLLFLFSVGTFTSSLALIAAALVLIHGFGWSIELHIPS